MTIPITIDISELVNELNLVESQIEDFKNRVLEKIGSKFHAEWKKKADVLKKTKERYVKSLYIDRSEMPNSITVGLPDRPDNWVSMAVEKGHPAYDLKEEFQKSGKVKQKKDGGWYITVPFQHATPGTVTEGMFATRMPEEVYKVAQKLPFYQQGSKQVQQLDASKLPSPYNERKTNRTEPITLKSGKIANPYTHANPIYDGMIKAGKSKHTSYMTFRRASDKSDDNSWIHSGITAHNLAQKTVNDFNFERELAEAKREYFEQI